VGDEDSYIAASGDLDASELRKSLAEVEHEANGLILIFLGEAPACSQDGPSACSQRRPLTDCLQDRKRSLSLPLGGLRPMLKLEERNFFAGDTVTLCIRIGYSHPVPAGTHGFSCRARGLPIHHGRRRRVWCRRGRGGLRRYGLRRSAGQQSGGWTIRWLPA